MGRTDPRRIRSYWDRVGRKTKRILVYREFLLAGQWFLHRDGLDHWRSLLGYAQIAGTRSSPIVDSCLLFAHDRIWLPGI